MNKTSKVKCVFWNVSHQKWYARTMRNGIETLLYRGDSQEEAENIMLDYFAQTKRNNGQNKYKRMSGLVYLGRPASPCNYRLEQYYEQ